MSVWELWFGWPGGQVWPNLVAAAVGSIGTAALILWRFLAKVQRAHEQEREARKAELAAHHQAVTDAVAAQLAEHHQAVLAAVTPSSVKEGM